MSEFNGAQRLPGISWPPLLLTHTIRSLQESSKPISSDISLLGKCQLSDLIQDTTALDLDSPSICTLSPSWAHSPFSENQTPESLPRRTTLGGQFPKWLSVTRIRYVSTPMSEYLLVQIKCPCPCGRRWFQSLRAYLWSRTRETFLSCSPVWGAALPGTSEGKEGTQSVNLSLLHGLSWTHGRQILTSMACSLELDRDRGSPCTVTCRPRDLN